ncbi:protein nessun dorma [Anthonomus grandis grandis]|uniref:protein nessun dorma n=1 Tax=Anthonomus grandis grandis TaxID=2921223 RepID=UPI002166986B|nr:protein nessun dorma [Anthonomus grandis grandis]
MDQIITFDKSLKTRLEEYKEVFSCETLPYSKIQSEWGYYLELILDPLGWQALWKIPRVKCEELKISFPTVVLVLVLRVNYSNLEAHVKILAVQDDIHLPEKHFVPLIQLWPTKDQDKSIALDLVSTANCLDMLRFFYIHLLMPWDEDDDVSDWKAAHLLSRLHLYYDLKNGNIPKSTAEHIHALLNEARRLNTKRQQLVSQCGEFDSDIEGSEDQNVETLIEINVRLIEIQNEMHLLENELFRKVILKRQQSEQNEVVKYQEINLKPSIWVICKDATATEYITLLKTIEKLYPDQSLSFALNLHNKLESTKSSEIILLSHSSNHVIKEEGALVDSITVKGIDNIATINSMADDVMFDCIGAECVFENIIINCIKTQCAILIRQDSNVTLKNCQIIGDESSTTHQGILVLRGAKLTLINCEIKGFSVALVGNSESTIDIKDTVIKGAISGIKIYDNCNISIYRTELRECKEYGVVIESDKQDGTDLISFEDLSGFSYIKMRNVTGVNNGKGNIKNKNSKIKAIEDLFENPDLYPTILVDSDEDSPENDSSDLNDTVLEVKRFKDDVVEADY